MYSNKITPILWGFALAIGVSSVALAAGISAPAMAGSTDKTVLPVKSSPPVLQSGATTLVTGDSNAVVSAYTFTAVDSGEQVSCRRTCAISAAQYVEMDIGSTPEQYAICFLVDGVYANGCPYSGVVGTGQTGVYFSGTAIQFITGLSAGLHTVQTQVFMTNTGGNLGYYSLRYDVLK